MRIEFCKINSNISKNIIVYIALNIEPEYDCYWIKLYMFPPEGTPILFSSDYKDRASNVFWTNSLSTLVLQLSLGHEIVEVSLSKLLKNMINGIL